VPTDQKILADDVFSLRDIARAADVDVADVERWVQRSGVSRVGDYVTRADAVAGVRGLLGGGIAVLGERSPLTTLEGESRRGGAGLAASGALHALFAAALVLMTIGVSGAVE
jgi:hypothetical protein